MNAFTTHEATAIEAASVRQSTPWVHASGHMEPGLGYQAILDASSIQIVGYQVLPGRNTFNTEAINQQIDECPLSGLLLLDIPISDESVEKGYGIEASSLETIRRHRWTERELVVHIVATRKQSTWYACKLLQESGVATAVDYDDMRHDLLSVDTFVDARLIRFRAAALMPERGPVAAGALCLLNAAKRLGIQTLVTAVATHDQAIRARALGIDWLQGPIFAAFNEHA